MPQPGDLVLEMESLEKAKHTVNQAKAEEQKKKLSEGKDKGVEQVKIKF